MNEDNARQTKCNHFIPEVWLLTPSLDPIHGKLVPVRITRMPSAWTWGWLQKAEGGLLSSGLIWALMWLPQVKEALWDGRQPGSLSSGFPQWSPRRAQFHHRNQKANPRGQTLSCRAFTSSNVHLFHSIASWPNTVLGSANSNQGEREELWANSVGWICSQH